jgi:hypothetical protein
MRELVTRFLAVSVLAILCLPGLEAATPRLIHPSVLAKPSLGRTRQPWLLVPRGGSDSNDEYDDEDKKEEEGDDEEEDDETANEYDEEVEEDDVVIIKSAVKATEKLQAKKTAVTKKAVNAKLSTPKKKKGPSLVKRYVPYIVRACLSPVTLFAMTKGYFQSLFNLDYLAEVCLICDHQSCGLQTAACRHWRCLRN